MTARLCPRDTYLRVRQAAATLSDAAVRDLLRPYLTDAATPALAEVSAAVMDALADALLDRPTCPPPWQPRATAAP
jgi:hypothetical protein